MTRIRALLLTCLILPGCDPNEVETTPEVPGLRGLSPVPIDLSEAFTAFGATGIFLSWDGGDELRSHGAGRAGERFPPASTFKIPHAMIALELGVVADEHETIPWDGTDRGGPGWNRDHDLTSALRVSAVWYFQEMARRIGRERMDGSLERLEYGNRSSEGELDRFWLDGGLRISPLEQLGFLVRLREGRLPIRPEIQATVRRMLAHELPDGRRIAAKTGWATEDGRHHGWYVGWTGPEPAPRYFVLYLTSEEPGFPMRQARQEILSRALNEISGDEITALRGVTGIDGLGNPPLPYRAIVMEDGRIQSIVPSSDLPAASFPGGGARAGRPG